MGYLEFEHLKILNIDRKMKFYEIRVVKFIEKHSWFVFVDSWITFPTYPGWHIHWQHCSNIAILESLGFKIEII